VKRESPTIPRGLLEALEPKQLDFLRGYNGVGVMTAQQIETHMKLVESLKIYLPLSNASRTLIAEVSVAIAKGQILQTANTEALLWTTGGSQFVTEKELLIQHGTGNVDSLRINQSQY